MDIRQGTPFCAPIQIYAGTYADAEGSDVVIVTSGVARKPGQTRIDLAQTNVNIIKSLTPEIVKYAPNAIYVFVGEPGGHPDLCVQQGFRHSGKPHHRFRHHPGHRAPALAPGRVLCPSARRTCTPTCSASTATARLCRGRCAQHRPACSWKITARASTTATMCIPNLSYDEIEQYMRTSGAQDHRPQGRHVLRHRHFRVPHRAKCSSAARIR